jgi:HemY protein
LKLAKTAFALKPRHGEVQDALLRLQAQTADWKGARETLNAKLKYGSLPRDLHKRRDAVLALSEARDVLDEGKDIEAREAAIEANRLSPDLVPAAVLAARSYIAQGSKRYATRVIKKAWGVHPHPDLAAAFAEIEPDETPAQRLKRFSKLIAMHPDNRETKLLEAELHLAAEEFPAARRALGDLVETDPDTRVLTIMAAIERGEGSSDAVVKGWLARALSAPRGPQWVCDKCQHIHAEWAPACDNCHAFDTLSWKTPPSSTMSTSTGIEMLPLIVGAIEQKPTEEEQAQPEEDDVVDAELVDETPDTTDEDSARK